MLSGCVSASFSAAIMRAFSRASTGSGNSGCCRQCASTSSAASRCAALLSVRSTSPERSASNCPLICAPISANLRAMSSSFMPCAPRSSMPKVMPATPTLPATSKPLPAGKFTATSSIGRPWSSTKYTRAPLGACQCWICGVASATPAAQLKTMMEKNLAKIMAHASGMPGFTRQRLRIEHRHRQMVIVEYLARHVLHLLRRDGLQFLQYHRDVLVRQARGFHLADLHRLIEHGVALVHLVRHHLRLDALQLVGAHAITHQLRQLLAQRRLQVGHGLALARRAFHLEQGGAARHAVI